MKYILRVIIYTIWCLRYQETVHLFNSERFDVIINSSIMIDIHVFYERANTSCDLLNSNSRYLTLDSICLKNIDRYFYHTIPIVSTGTKTVLRCIYMKQYFVFENHMFLKLIDFPQTFYFNGPTTSND